MEQRDSSVRVSGGTQLQSVTKIFSFFEGSQAVPSRPSWKNICFCIGVNDI
jgi:hypothetical protein